MGYVLTIWIYSQGGTFVTIFLSLYKTWPGYPFWSSDRRGIYRYNLSWLLYFPTTLSSFQAQLHNQKTRYLLNKSTLNNEFRGYFESHPNQLLQMYNFPSHLASAAEGLSSQLCLSAIYTEDQHEIQFLRLAELN